MRASSLTTYLLVISACLTLNVAYMYYARNAGKTRTDVPVVDTSLQQRGVTPAEKPAPHLPQAIQAPEANSKPKLTASSVVSTFPIETMPSAAAIPTTAVPLPSAAPTGTDSVSTRGSPFPLPLESVHRLKTEYEEGVRSLPKDIFNGKDRTPSYPLISGDGFRHLCRLRCEDEFTDCNFKAADVKDGDCIYIAAFDLKDMHPTTDYLHAYRRLSPQIQHRHVVVSHNGDMSMPDGDQYHKYKDGRQYNSMPSPEEFSILLESPFLLAWFASNCNWKASFNGLVYAGNESKPSKLHCIPLGIENRYNEVGRHPEAYFRWMEHRQKVTPTKLLFAGFTSAINKALRDAAVEAFAQASWVTKHAHSAETPVLNQEQYFTSLLDHKFAACPPGHGFDTHRLWETLMAGVFPVVISGPMDAVYEDLPILVVKKWTDVTQELLKDTLVKFRKRDMWRTDKIFHTYWSDLILRMSSRTV